MRNYKDSRNAFISSSSLFLFFLLLFTAFVRQFVFTRTTTGEKPLTSCTTSTNRQQRYVKSLLQTRKTTTKLCRSVGCSHNTHLLRFVDVEVCNRKQYDVISRAITQKYWHIKLCTAYRHTMILCIYVLYIHIHTSKTYTFIIKPFSENFVLAAAQIRSIVTTWFGLLNRFQVENEQTVGFSLFSFDWKMFEYTETRCQHWTSFSG